MDLPTIRAAVKTLAADATDGASLTLLTARIVLGIDMHANANTFLATLSSSGPYMIVQPGALVDDPESLGGGRMYEVPCSLYVGYARETDQTFTAAETLLEDIRAQLRDGGFSAVEWEQPEVNHKREPGYAMWRLRVRRRGC